MKRLLGNLPLILGLAIWAGFSMDLPFLAPLKTETTFGLWVAVLVPVAILLLAGQIVLWVVNPGTRPWGRSGASPGN